MTTSSPPAAAPPAASAAAASAPAPQPSPAAGGTNPLAHKDPKVRLLNSALLLGLVHIGLFLWGNENATPLKLIASFALMMALLGGLAVWRSRRASVSALLSPGGNFPGAAP